MFTISQAETRSTKQIKNALDFLINSRQRLNVLSDYYNGNHSILERKKAVILSNNIAIVNHAEYITDINTGYLLGNAVEYQADEGNIDAVTDEYRKQNIANLDSVIAQDLSVFGKAYEFVYTDDNNVKSITIDPRNALIVYNNSMSHEPLYGIFFSDYQGFGEARTYSGVTVFDRYNTYKYSDDLKTITEEFLHPFPGLIPLLEYSNNRRQTGDFESVISLIDAYNILTSDRINDKEQLVNALLVMSGFELTSEQIDALKIERVLAIPENGAKIEYLTKNLNETEIQVLATALERLIHKISKTPNLSDENFVGNSSGVAIRYKLFVFEQNIKNKESYMRKGLLNRFKLYSRYLSILKNTKEIELYNITAIFKRNLPQNDYEASQMIGNLDGLVSKETLLAQLSFVENSKDEIKWASEEKQKEVEVYGGENISETILE